MYYLVVAILVFISVIVHSTYTESYPDGSYFRSDSGEQQALLTCIAFMIAVIWPLTIVGGISYGLVKLVIYATLKMKDRKNAKAN